MAVAAQRRAQAVPRRRRLVGQQPGQVAGLAAGRGLGDDLGRGRADAWQRLQRARLHPAAELARRQPAEHLGGPPEGPDAVGRRPAPLQLERDPPQRPHRVILHRVILHWVILHRSSCTGSTFVSIPRWRRLGRRCGQSAVVEVLQQGFRAILEV